MITHLAWLAHHLPLVVAGILGLGAVIAFHECGHFIFCKLFDVHVPSFSIGFGPQLLKKQIGETTFSLSLIPVGGYVEAESNQTELTTSQRSLESKPYWQKLLIAFGGIFFNLIFAYVILVGLSITGIPANPFLIQKGTYSLKKIMPGSAAEKAGLQPGDRLISINDHPVSEHISKLFEALEPLAHKEATVIFERNGEHHTVNTILDAKSSNGKEVGILGIEEFTFPSLPPTNFVTALIQGAKLTQELIASSIRGLTQAFKKRSADNFAGPLMMISLTVASAKKGFSLFLIFLVVISVTLAVINIIPLPILDGGRIFTFTLEAIIRRPLPESFHLFMGYLSWGLMILLFVLLTVKDAKNLFWN